MRYEYGMSHFSRNQRYSTRFRPSVYSEGVKGFYGGPLTWGMTGLEYTGWGGEGRALYKDAKEALEKAVDGEPLDSFQAEDLTLDQGIEDVSTRSATTSTVNLLGAYLQASIAMSWASRRLGGSLRQEALELAAEYIEEGSCRLCVVDFDAGNIASFNLEVQEKLRSLSDRAGFPARGGDLSYLLSMYGDTDARSSGTSLATKVDVEAIEEEQELARQRTPGGIVGDAGKKTLTDMECALELGRGIFTGREPREECKPEYWAFYKWGFRIGIGLVLVGYAGNALKPIIELVKGDKD